MALSKQYTAPDGIPLSHFRLMPGRIDPVAREASFHVAAYVNASVPSNKPAKGYEIFAKLRLTGDKFDLYLSKSALTAAAIVGHDIYAVLYLALKIETQTGPEQCVICDAGSNFFADAENV